MRREASCVPVVIEDTVNWCFLEEKGSARGRTGSWFRMAGAISDCGGSGVLFTRRVIGEVWMLRYSLNTGNR